MGLAFESTAREYGYQLHGQPCMFMQIVTVFGVERSLTCCTTKLRNDDEMR